MARTVEVSLKLDGQGVVEEVDAGSLAFKEMADEAEEAGDKIDETAAKASKSMENTGDSARDAATGVESAGQAAEDTAASNRKLASTSDQAASAQVNMRRATNNANQVLFSAGDAVQDLQFGLIGVGNNIGFMAEQFANVRQQAGGTRAAFGALAGSLTGVGGLILGLQALIALGPSIIDFFSGAEDGAKEAQEALEGLAESLIGIQGLGDVELQPLSAERAGQVATALERERGIAQALVDDLQALQDALRAVESGEGAGRAGARDVRAAERVRRLREELQLQGASRQEIDRILDREQQRLRFADAALSQVQAQADELSQQERFTRFLEEFGLERVQNEEDAAEAMEQQAMNLQAIGSAMEQLQGFDLPGVEPDRLSGVAGVLQEVQRVLSQGTTQPLSNVEGALSSLQASLQRVGSQEARAAIQALIDDMQGLRDEMRGVGTDSQEVNRSLSNLQGIVSGALSGGFKQLGQAIGEGQSAMQAFGQAAASIISSIASAIGQQLISIGTALVASAILPGQQGNAAAGAAYIAAGGTLLAASGALSSIGGGGTGGAGAAAGGGTGRTTIQRGGAFGGAIAGSDERAQNTGQSQNVNVQGTIEARIGVDDPFALESMTSDVRQTSDTYLESS